MEEGINIDEEDEKINTEKKVEVKKKTSKKIKKKIIKKKSGVETGKK